MDAAGLHCASPARPRDRRAIAQRFGHACFGNLDIAVQIGDRASHAKRPMVAARRDRQTHGGVLHQLTRAGGQAAVCHEPAPRNVGVRANPAKRLIAAALNTARTSDTGAHDR